SADIRWPGRINTPATVFILMLNNPVGRLAEALRVTRAQKRMQKYVVRFQRGVGFQLAAPVAFFMLGGEKKSPCRVRGGAHAAGQSIDLSKAKLRRRSQIRFNQLQFI